MWAARRDRNMTDVVYQVADISSPGDSEIRSELFKYKDNIKVTETDINY